LSGTQSQNPRRQRGLGRDLGHQEDQLPVNYQPSHGITRPRRISPARSPLEKKLRDYMLAGLVLRGQQVDEAVLAEVIAEFLDDHGHEPRTTGPRVAVRPGPKVPALPPAPTLSLAGFVPRAV
jgi:hypothetical protein